MGDERASLSLGPRHCVLWLPLKSFLVGMRGGELRPVHRVEWALSWDTLSVQGGISAHLSS